MALREYQQEDLAALREAMRAGARSILFEASVGYGKSVIIEHLAQCYSNAGKPVLVLSNRSAVIDQLHARAGHLPGVDVMTVQAADRRRDTLQPYALQLIDEVHMGGAQEQYARVMATSPDAVKVGFTGSPRPATFDVFPAHIQGKGARWLTAQGFLSPLRYLCPSPLDLSGVKVVQGEYDPAQVIEALEKARIYDDAIRSYREHARGGPCLAFCVNIKHAEKTAAEFQEAGIPSQILTGKTRDVQSKIDYLKAGGLLFTVDKVSAGFDLPDLPVILSLRPTKSEQLWIQQLGRVARAAEGKAEGLVIDHVGNTLKLGTLTMERDWKIPMDSKPERVTEAGESLAIRQCGECLAAFEAGPACCPYCGVSLAKETRIPKAEAVRLKELSKAEEKAIEARRKAVIKRMGGGYKQKRGFQVHQLGKSWEEAHAIAISQLKKRLDDALRYGDQEMETMVRAELEQYG